MTDNTQYDNMTVNLSEDRLREIIEDAAHNAAKKVNLVAQLEIINSRLSSVERAIEEEREQMREAVRDGIIEGLRRVNLDDEKAGSDLADLRGLLSAWNDVKAAIWGKVKHIIAVAILGGIAYLVSKFSGINFAGN